MDTTTISLQYRDEIFNLPSPQYANRIIRDLKLHYNPELLNDYSVTLNYNSSISKALNLGIYGTDLGYLNIFSMGQETTLYLKSIQLLCDGLEIHDRQVLASIKKIGSSLGDPDSLMYYLSEAYIHAGRYFHENQRSEIASLILAGGWIESFYFLARYYEDHPGPILYNYIGEQKYPLENLIRLLAPYYNKNDQITRVIDLLVDLAYEFDIIDFNYTYSSIEHDSSERLSIINSETRMEVSTGTLKNITRKAKLIRNEIVN